MNERVQDLQEKVQRLGTAIAKGARWFVRAARAGIVIGLAVGAAAFLVVIAGDVVDGPALLVAAVVCLVPAASFATLWWRARQLIRDVGQLPDDVRVAVTHLQTTPRQITDGVARLEATKGVVRRARTLRDVMGDLRDLDPAASEARDRFERVYLTLGTMAPIAALAVGSVVAGALAVPVLIVVALVT